VGTNASATDNVAVAKVAIYLDNVAVAACPAATCSFDWNTRKSNDTGKHVIGARAWDSSGNLGYATSVTVTVAK
jgi:hypothetical protein